MNPKRESSGPLTPEEARIYEESFVQQKLENIFFLDKENPALVGPFLWSEVDGRAIEAACFKGAIAFCAKHKAPLLIEFTGFGASRTINFESAQSLLKEIKTCTGETHKGAIVLAGIYPEVSNNTELASGQLNQSRKVDLLGLKEIVGHGYHLQINIFGWLRAGLTILELVFAVKYLLSEFPNLANVSIGLGLIYRTELPRFGGPGNSAFIELLTKLSEAGVSDHNIKNLVSRNALSVICWWRPLVLKKVEVILWKCDECAKEFEESVPKITKLDFQFCSPKCFKAGLKKIPK